MRYIFKFPDIGEGIDEGTIAEWYIEKGQTVQVGDALCKMETDKVVTDIPSPKNGTISARYGKIGETINVGDPLVEIEIEGTEADAGNEQQTEAVEEEGAGVVGTLEIAGNNAFLPASDEGFDEKEEEDKKPKKKALATPVARAMAKELGVDISKVTGTGPANRVMKEDIQNHFNQSGKSKTPSNSNISGENEVEIEPLSQLRKSIARNMVQSKQNAAHMSVFDEIEIEELIRIRTKYKERFAEQNVKLSYLPFVLKATAMALRKFKALNSEMDLENNQMIYKKYYNIGIAVDTPDGLVVPVIRNVDKKTIFELASEINEMAHKARNKEISLDDMKDGTFTITSFGSIGGMFAVPVINYPQAGILGIGRIVQKPVVKNNQIVPGNVLPLSMSVDHRIVDGGEVTRFLNQIMEYLSDPVSLIID
ncbi:MAG: dihydrolipoamide acyltransferase [Marinilabiliales bacterium]|nr:MAG: dihydrolipoamide acyltransferase [Marinilabiliales bacterium]